MSDALHTHAEILKLARLLRRDPATLNYLEVVSPADIRALRGQVTDMLFSAHGSILERLAAASRILPVGVVATIGERAFGPVLSARVAGMLDPERAVEMSGKLPTSFLADVASEIDPRRTGELLSRIPPRQIAEITRELLRREEYVTIGRFVGHIPQESIAAATGVMDEQSLLRTAFVLEEKDRLDELIDTLGDQRSDEIIKAAAEGGLWREALDLLSNLGDRWRQKFAERAVAQDDAVVDSLIAAAQEHGLWDAVLPMSRLMSEAGRRRFANRPSIQRPDVLDSIVEATARNELWDELLPLLDALPAGAREHAERQAAQFRQSEGTAGRSAQAS